MQAAAGFDLYHVPASSPGGSIDYLLGRTDQPNSNSVGDYYGNVLFYLGNKEDLMEEEAEFLKEALVNRKVKEKH
ncbi:hypothetical protein [Paenibacillus sp. RC67]|uniref:hypothetical protein n=1 Tax=Paenibacillus sp. RC67 TaxID=3039392 RepID=UPI0024AE6792|nr:hypothetical protein [Paenibacillus sp. RC67]